VAGAGRTHAGAAPSQRRVYLAVISVSTAGVLPVFLLGGLAVQVRADLGIAESTQGWIAFGYFGVSALTSALLGRLVERIGPTRGMRLAACMSTTALLGAALSGSFAVLLPALALGGMANALAQPGSNAFIVAGVPLRRNGLAFGVKQSAIPAATLLAGLAVPTVALTVGWRWAFAGAAVLAAGAAIGVPRVPAPPSRRALEQAGERPPRVRPQVAVVTLGVLGIGAGLGASSANALGSFLTSTAVDAGIDPGTAGILLSLGSGIGLATRLVLGWRADTMTGSLFRVVTTMLVVGSSGFLALAFGTPATVLAGTVVAFAAGWSWPGIFNLAVVHHNREAPAAATGVTQTGTYAGGAVGPLAFGYLVVHGGYGRAWAAFVGIALAAAAVIEIGRRRIER
jgi:MFS family permease